MSVVEVLQRQGGVASRAALLNIVGRGELDRAVAAGAVVRLARGRYGLPELNAAVSMASRLNGVLCLSSAALHHGWEVKWVPKAPHVVVPKWRPARTSQAVHIHRANLQPHQIDGVATAAETTLEQCLRTLPFDEALAIADSALRHGVPPGVLVRLGEQAIGPGSRRIRRVSEAAAAEAANPFESVLRAIALDVPGLSPQPQVWVRPGVRSDLADARLRIVLEADSFQWHGGRAALARDARRYNELVIVGWVVLRFSWEDVMFDADYVRRTLSAATSLAERLVRNGPHGHAA